MINNIYFNIQRLYYMLWGLDYKGTIQDIYTNGAKKGELITISDSRYWNGTWRVR